MEDVNGKPITAGSRLRRVVAGSVTAVGYEYQTVEYDFSGNGTAELVADGGFVKELLSSERAKEFEVIK